MNIDYFVFFAFVGTGAFAGLLSGLLGIGGGIIVVPILAFIFQRIGVSNHVLMHMATGTSIAAMVATTGSSMYAHMRRGAAIWPVYRRLALGIVIGVVLGVLFADQIPSDLLSLIFGLFVIAVSIRMSVVSQIASQRTLPGNKVMFSFATLIGGKSGLLGIGGGALTVPFLTYCNVAMRSAVAISATCGFTIAIVGSISVMLTGLNEAHLPAWSTGYVYWPAVLGIIVTSPLFARLGARLSYRLPVNILKKIFAIFLLFMGIDMLFRVI